MLRSHGNREYGGRAHVHVAFELEPAAMRGGNATNDGETQTAAAAGGTAADEGLLNALQVVLRDAAAMVGHHELNGIVIQSRFELDVHVAGVADGVVEQCVLVEHGG